MAYTFIPESPEFARFWKVYPNKKNKGDAKKAWEQTAHIRPPIDDILKAVTIAKTTEQWMQENGRFVPMPASWLRGERWEDSADVELPDVVNGKMWHETSTGITAKGVELGISLDQFDGDFQAFRRAVESAASKVVKLRA